MVWGEPCKPNTVGTLKLRVFGKAINKTMSLLYFILELVNLIAVMEGRRSLLEVGGCELLSLPVGVTVGCVWKNRKS